MEVKYMAEWLPSLITNTPEEGFNLAITLSRKTVGLIQPDEEVRKVYAPHTQTTQ